MKKCGLLWLVPLIVLGGCGSPSIYIESKVNGGVSIDQTSKVVFFDPDDGIAGASAVCSVLNVEMGDLGYNLMSFEEADYFLLSIWM